MFDSSVLHLLLTIVATEYLEGMNNYKSIRTGTPDKIIVVTASDEPLKNVESR